MSTIVNHFIMFSLFSNAVCWRIQTWPIRWWKLWAISQVSLRDTLDNTDIFLWPKWQFLIIKMWPKQASTCLYLASYLGKLIFTQSSNILSSNKKLCRRERIKYWATIKLFGWSILDSASYFLKKRLKKNTVESSSIG